MLILVQLLYGLRLCSASLLEQPTGYGVCDITDLVYADEVYYSLILFPRPLPLNAEIDAIIRKSERLSTPSDKLCRLVYDLKEAALDYDTCRTLVSHFNHLKSQYRVEAAVITRLRWHLGRRARSLAAHRPSREERTARSALKAAEVNLYAFGLQLHVTDEVVESLVFRFRAVPKALSRKQEAELLSNFEPLRSIPPYYEGEETPLMVHASLSNIIATVNTWRYGLLAASDFTCNSILRSTWISKVVSQTRQVLQRFTMLMQRWFIDDERLGLSRREMEGIVFESDVAVAELQKIEEGDRLVSATDRALVDLTIAIIRYAEALGFIFEGVKGSYLSRTDEEDLILVDGGNLSIDRKLYSDYMGRDQDALREMVMVDFDEVKHRIEEIVGNAELPALENLYYSIDGFLNTLIRDEREEAMMHTSTSVADLFDAVLIDIEDARRELAIVKGCLRVSRKHRRDEAVATRLGKVWDGIKVAITAWVHATNAIKIRLEDLTV